MQPCAAVYAPDNSSQPPRMKFTTTTLTLLLTALNASTSWTVETAELCGEVCRIRMV